MFLCANWKAENCRRKKRIQIEGLQDKCVVRKHESNGNEEVGYINFIFIVS